MDFICAANWKMNLSFQQAQAFLSDFKIKLTQIKQAAPAISSKQSSMAQTAQLKSFFESAFCFFPQAVHAPLFQDHLDLNWGAQDFYFESEGAYTGQNSPEIFKELGANVMLIGHSERRTLFHETDQMIAKKIQKCEAMQLIPLLCIGETLQDRDAGLTLKVLEKQLKGAFAAQPQNLIVAYEPVWAIGTGHTASVEDVDSVHSFIKDILGQHTPILYGGSVKPENAKELSALKGVDGFLIGGASLKVDTLLSIYQNSVKN